MEDAINSTAVIGGWGRHIPQDMADKILATWGARAIYNGQRIDLLPDRQTWWLKGFSEDDAGQTSVEYENWGATMHNLSAWINNVGLPYLQHQAKGLYTNEDLRSFSTFGPSYNLKTGAIDPPPWNREIPSIWQRVKHALKSL